MCSLTTLLTSIRETLMVVLQSNDYGIDNVYSILINACTSCIQESGGGKGAQEVHRFFGKSRQGHYD